MAEETKENAAPQSATIAEKKEVKVAVGDIVSVHAKIKEGGKERIQIFSGTVICKRGSGPASMFTVRRISHGVGVERVFPANSPNIAAVEVKSSQRVRRSKLYHVRRHTSRKIKV